MRGWAQCQERARIPRNENGALSTVLDDDRDVLTAVGKLDQIGPVIGPLAPRTDKDAACHIRAITIWLRPS
jgi:hypothetical protein